MEAPNLLYIKNLSDGDTDFEQKLLDIIKHEFPIEKKEYLDNICNNNYKLAASNVHKLKHKISILGLLKGDEISVEFENNLLKGDTSLQDEFESILDLISNYLENTN